MGGQGGGEEVGREAQSTVSEEIVALTITAHDVHVTMAYRCLSMTQTDV